MVLSETVRAIFASILAILAILLAYSVSLNIVGSIQSALVGGQPSYGSLAWNFILLAVVLGVLSKIIPKQEQ